MSYQPPLIGFKQLLNFGAYSFPDTGGWLFFGVGIAILLAYIKESFFRKTNLHPVICISFLVFGFTGCSVRNPEPVKLNTDNCTYCKMTIAEEKFAAELITNKGKLFKFDDLYCMLQYKKLNVSTEKNRYFVANYSKPKQFLDATTAVYIQNNQLKSPMLGNMMAFPDLAAAQKNDPSGTIVLQNWEQIQLK
jgi:copper chaperone NosL